MEITQIVKQRLLRNFRETQNETLEIDLLRRIYLYYGKDYIDNQLVSTYFYTFIHDDTLIRK